MTVKIWVWFANDKTNQAGTYINKTYQTHSQNKQLITWGWGISSASLIFDSWVSL